MAGREQGPGWRHSERGTLPLSDLVNTHRWFIQCQVDLFITERLSEAHETDTWTQILTGVHLSGQDVHRHLVSLRGFDCQPILQGHKQTGDARRAAGNTDAGWFFFMTNSIITITKKMHTYCIVFVGKNPPRNSKAVTVRNWKDSSLFGRECCYHRRRDSVWPGWPCAFHSESGVSCDNPVEI